MDHLIFMRALLFFFTKKNKALQHDTVRLIIIFKVISLGFEPRAHTLKVYCSTS